MKKKTLLSLTVSVIMVLAIITASACVPKTTTTRGQPRQHTGDDTDDYYNFLQCQYL